VDLLSTLAEALPSSAATVVLKAVAEQATATAAQRIRGSARTRALVDSVYAAVIIAAFEARRPAAVPRDEVEWWDRTGPALEPFTDRALCRELAKAAFILDRQQFADELCNLLADQGKISLGALAERLELDNALFVRELRRRIRRNVANEALSEDSLRPLVLVAAANRAWQERQEANYRATIRELRQLNGPLEGRDNELGQIREFATGSGGYRWLVGGVFAGKTALLAEAAAQLWQVDAVAYFLSRAKWDADSNRFLNAVIPQLAYLLDEDAPERGVDQFTALWERAADAAAAGGRHLLLIVDGLDEDWRPSGSPSVAAILPTNVGDHAHVLVSSHQDWELPTDVPPKHPLHHAHRVALEPYKGAQELRVLALREIDNLKKGDDRDLAIATLGVLTAASGPLSVADLAALTSDPARPSPAHASRVRQLITRSAPRSIRPSGPKPQQRYSFAHTALLEAARSDGDLGDPGYRMGIHEWAERWRAAGWPSEVTTGDTATPRYLFDTYPRTLHSEPPRLVALMTDVGWVLAAVDAIGVDAVLAELRTATAVVPTEVRVAGMHAAHAVCAHLLRGRPAPLRASYLELEARRAGLDELADAIASAAPERPWRTRWARRRPVRPHQVVGRHSGPVQTVAVGAPADNTRVAVSGGDDETVRVWQLPDGTPLGEPRLGHYGEVLAVAVSKLTDGTPVTVSFGLFGTVRVERLVDGVQVAAGKDLGTGIVQAAAVGTLADCTPVAVSGDDEGTLRVMRLADCSSVGDPLRSDDGELVAVTVGALADGTAVTVSVASDGCATRM